MRVPLRLPVLLQRTPPGLHLGSLGKPRFLLLHRAQLGRLGYQHLRRYLHLLLQLRRSPQPGFVHRGALSFVATITAAIFAITAAAGTSRASAQL